MLIKALTLALAMSAGYAAGNGIHSASSSLTTWLVAQNANSVAYASAEPYR